MQEKEILKELLLVELEDMKSFDEDPMGFILRKYVSLNQTMVELMTRAYRDYLYGVYIVAPKPTTFKIVLHNKQYFYLMYLGPTYQASVAGKNYYLSDLGEKERCIVAISKLLRGGAPINTKGPEGAEQGAKDETGGGGGGGSTSGGGGGGGEEGGGEEELSASPEGGEGGGEEPEELTESAKMVLKLLLEQELDKTEKSPEEQDSDKEKKGEDTQKEKESKKKSRIPQTPILQRGSLTPSALNLTSYSNSEQIRAALTKSLNSITGEDSEQVSKTKQFLLSLCDDVIQKAKTTSELEGAHKIQFSKTTIEALSGVNRKDLNIIGIEFGEVLGAIYLGKIIKINKKRIAFPGQANNQLYDFSVGKVIVSSKYKKGAASSLSKVIEENDKDTSKLTDKEKQLLSILSNSLKKRVSASYLYVAKKLNDPKINKAFSELNRQFKIDINEENLDSDIISLINNAMLKIRKQKKGGKILSKKLNSFYSVIGRRKIPDGQEVDWNSLPGGDKENAELSDIAYYGLITSPMSYFLTDVINSKKDEKGDDNPYLLLKQLIQNTSVTQARLNFSLKEKSATFSVLTTKSEGAKFTFHPKVTSNQPEKGFMSFRME